MEELGVKPEEVKFVARLLKLSTASARFLLFHYVDGDKYQLPILKSEVTMKVSRDAYSALLLMLKASSFIMTVQGNVVVTVAPFQELSPVPKFSIDRRFAGLCITSSVSVIDKTRVKLENLPYHNSHEYLRLGSSSPEKHFTRLREMFTWKIESCGCCRTIILKNNISCPKCNKEVSGVDCILGFWAVFRSNLPIESFSTKLVEEPSVRKTDVTALDGNREVGEGED